jgi:hypothetical protein
VAGNNLAMLAERQGRFGDMLDACQLAISSLEPIMFTKGGFDHQSASRISLLVNLYASFYRAILAASPQQLSAHDRLKDPLQRQANALEYLSNARKIAKKYLRDGHLYAIIAKEWALATAREDSSAFDLHLDCVF